MLKLEKRLELSQVGDVICANGTVEFNGTNMNVYSFAVDGVLIDTGSESLLNEFRPFLNTADYDQVVLTHIHEDHTGGAPWIAKNRDIPFYIHPMSVADCTNEGVYPAYRHVVWGDRKPFTAQPIQNTFQSRSATWDVIETPGHAADHLAFYNRDMGVLFSGDLYVQTKTKVVLREENIPQIIRSIEHVLTYDFQEVFCCHAGFLANGRELFQEKLDYLKDISGQVKLLHEKGHDPQEIKQFLFPKSYPISLFSEGEWDALHIVNSILADNHVEIE